MNISAHVCGDLNACDLALQHYGLLGMCSCNLLRGYAYCCDVIRFWFPACSKESHAVLNNRTIECKKKTTIQSRPLTFDVSFLSIGFALLMDVRINKNALQNYGFDLTM